MKLIPDFIIESMKDGDGRPSSSRLIAVSTVFTVVILVALIWFVLSAVSGRLLDIPGSVTGFASAASGISLAMFGFNKRAE